MEEIVRNRRIAVSEVQSGPMWFIEEPTSPDDVLGHRKIKEGINSEVQAATADKPLAD